MSAVRRWGWRAVGLTVTGVGLYVVAPSLVAMLDQWPDLQTVRPVWFVLLVLLQAGSLAALSSTWSGCGPSSSQSRRCVPSPNRWRSRSPIGRATLAIAARVRRRRQ